MTYRNSLTALFILLFMQLGHAQLDRYKYIVVPVQFEGFKNQNQYRTSTLIKLLFSREGFNVVYDNQLPEDLATKPCSALKVQLVDVSSLLSTKVKLALEDCYGQVVFETPEGTSKIKEYEPAYQEAIERAFDVLVGTGYSYNPAAAAAGDASAPPPTRAERLLNPPAPKEEPPLPQTGAAVVAVEKGAGAEADAPEPDLWYAQPLDNGFQLVDSSPKVQMKLVSTTQPDTFIAMVGEAPKGMVYKKEGQWWHEYYDEGKVQLRKLRIKF